MDVNTLMDAVKARADQTLQEVKTLRADIASRQMTTVEAFDQFIAMLQTLKASVREDYAGFDKRAVEIAAGLDGPGNGNVQRLLPPRRLTTRSN